jgi:hypothetical protein
MPHNIDPTEKQDDCHYTPLVLIEEKKVTYPPKPEWRIHEDDLWLIFSEVLFIIDSSKACYLRKGEKLCQINLKK